MKTQLSTLVAITLVCAIAIIMVLLFSSCQMPLR